MSNATPPVDRPRRRADAERNRARLLARAAQLLAADSATGMVEIADAAGVARGTLYRHFATREELISAIDELAMDETERAIADSRLEEGSAGEALQRLIAALLEIGDRYRFLVTDRRHEPTAQQRRAREERLGAPLYALVERGQATGELSRALSPPWMLTTLGAVLVAAIRDIDAGRLAREDAPATVTATLLYGYSGPG